MLGLLCLILLLVFGVWAHILLARYLVEKYSNRDLKKKNAANLNPSLSDETRLYLVKHYQWCRKNGVYKKLYGNK
ncbi:MAG: hypothetical protein FWH17_10445 [Oscillospiraceae bacterium]|nr:hypothetical protein [Oscillospiraceae bacterium]